MSDADTFDISTVVVTVIALLAIVQVGLLTPLLSGLLVYQLVQFAVPPLNRLGLPYNTGRTLVLTLIAIGITGLVVVGLTSLISWLSNGSESLPVLLTKMSEIVQSLQLRLPDWARPYLPSNLEEMENKLSEWLSRNADQLRIIGEHVGTTLVRIVIGMIIGGMIAATTGRPDSDIGPLGRALGARAAVLADAFRRIVFSQIRISAVNTVLTSLYLVVLLPMIGVQLPLVKTMILVTFIAGLIPVAGNIISNTVIVIVSSSVSLEAAVGSLLYLVVIHKLEYFLNARIIGGQIGARAWELLLAMLVMEAVFGVAGVIAGPIFYAYLKQELVSRRLI